MRKLVLIFLFSCLPFMQMASVLTNQAGPVLRKNPAQLKPAPELPLNVLPCLIQ